MSVWSFEAAEITDSKDLESRPIYRTPAIQEFLRSEKSQVRIISGLKGTGKTLFLKLISHHYRRLGGVTLIPANELTERLYSIDYDFSGERAKAWAAHERWKHVWRTVLSVVVLKAVRHDLPAELLEIFPSDLGLSIGAHLSAGIRHRAVSTAKFQEYFPGRLDAAIQGIVQPVALFLDNIDEALARHAGYDLYRDSVVRQSQSGAHSYPLWLAAQLGFVLAARELTSRNAHLKLYGTVRAEAIRDNPTSTAFNVQAMILDLHYSPDELRGIFATKLRRLQETSPQAFPRPSESDPIKAFFPFDTIAHPTVTNADGSAYLENAFDYLRRHTRGRPRELDFLGQEIQMIPPGLRTPDRIRELVRDLSHQFFTFARNEAVPFWDPRLDDLLVKLPSNFIHRHKAVRIAHQLFGEEGRSDLWGALFANGLCGAVVAVHPTGLVQRFSNHDRVADLSGSEFTSARTWIMHPCVNIATRALRVRYHPNARNVAGHAYSFVAEPRRRRKHVHVLIGAGKLGLGLVVPMLLANEETSVLVVARESQQWAPLLRPGGNGMASLEVNYFSKTGPRIRNYRVEMKVVADGQEEWHDLVQRGVRKERCVFLVSSHVASLQWAIGLGDSIGVSVGPKELETVATSIAGAASKPKVVLAYENDAEKMRKAAAILIRGDMALVPTVVDRICVEREIRDGAVVVKAEPYGRITALAERALFKYLPPAFAANQNAKVRVVDDEEEFAFVREKKTRLVNSLHAAAAALVLQALMDVGAREETADDFLLGLIAGNMEIRAQLVAATEVMILSVLGTLPPGRLTEGNLQELVSELDAYGKQALERMFGGPDRPSRVLRTDIRSLLTKHERLFADVESLALGALGQECVKAVLPLTESDVRARLEALQAAFLKLLAHAGKKSER
jgi:hypothetical protein